jgi:uncharacterized protein (TIGR03084 family)
VDDVLTALRSQLDELEGLLAPLDEAAWETPSACPGWSIADVVLHLAQTNEMAEASARGALDEAAGSWERAEGETVDDVAGSAVERGRGVPATEIHDRWRAGADTMVDAFAEVGPDERVWWVVGDMAARTLATTRIAETWIHTEDVAIGLGVDPPGTDRPWHICRPVHRTLPYAFERADRTAPGAVRFALTAPSGEPWSFGDDDAPTVIEGPALDLCRVAGQRLTAAETGLRGSGPDAEGVLALMRTFA